MKDNEGIKKFISEAHSYIISYFNANNKYGIDFSTVYKFDDDYYDNKVDINNLGKIALEDYLGNLYENSLTTEEKKDLGLFYTRNENVINRMLDGVDLIDKTILEPSCGSGTFIIQIIKKIIGVLKNKTAKEIIEYINTHIYANDIDKFAIAITEINILCVLMPLIIEASNADINFNIKKFNIFNFDFTKRDLFNNKFDIIIGNPPYVTMYGKRSRNMTEEKRSYFNTFDFVQNKNGNNKFNISMFFVENGMKSLKRNGRLIFILDISFFETAFIDLRKYIVQNYSIVRIIRDLQEFNNVASGQVIIDVCNKQDFDNIILNESFINDNIIKIKQQKYNDSNNKYKYFIPFNDIENRINEKVKKFNRLDFYFPNKALRTCCALTGKTEEFIVENNCKTECEIFPYIEGSKGLKEKFGKLENSRFIKYDYDLQIKISDDFKKELEALGVKNKKRVTLGDKDSYKSPKIFIRQSAFEIIATYTEQDYAANNSIYILTLKSDRDNDKDILKFVCGIINSDLITFYCKINRIIRAEKGKTPQIKTSDLKDIRICLPENNIKKEIIDIVDSLLLNEDKINLLNKLNAIVYSMYNIENDEIDFIQKYLKNN